jgi:hypothetical protein
MRKAAQALFSNVKNKRRIEYGFRDGRIRSWWDSGE